MKIRLRTKQGFTLMEMLIVIAIIVILLAIAIPSFASQLERTRESVDMSNIHAAYEEVCEVYLVNSYWGDGDIVNNTDPYTSVVKKDNCLIRYVKVKQKHLGWQNGDAAEGYIAKKPPIIGDAKQMDDYTAKATAYKISFNIDTREVTVTYVS